MSNIRQLKANFGVKIKHEPFYTGGKVQVSDNHIFCQCGEQVNVLDINTAETLRVINNDEGDPVTSFCVSPDGEYVVVAAQSLQFRQWMCADGTLKRKWKAVHTAPVTSMAFDSTSTLLATGGADSTVIVWDIVRKYTTHHFTGHQGVITVLAFHTDTLQLFSSGNDCKIRVWDLTKSVCLAELDGHYSAVTALKIQDSMLVSAGRDDIVTVWDTKSYQKKKTIPVFESIEGLEILQKDMQMIDIYDENVLHFVTVGNKGLLKVWSTKSASCVYQQEKQQGSLQDNQALVHLSYSQKRNLFNVVTVDHNIVMFNAKDMTLWKQFIGYSDQILDVKYLGENESHIAVSTNSPQIKVYDLESWNCQLLSGHTDIVLCLDVFKQGSLLASSSKDGSVRVWCLIEGVMHCIGVGQGHTHSVAAVAFAKQNANFLVSGSEDLTLKLWNIPEELTVDETARIAAKYTQKAHDKDINFVTVSPNDKLIATASQDKCAKLWDTELNLLGVFRGHKRGIWCAQFSPVDQCLVTGSADGTIKFWSLSDFNCAKSLEGHDSSVLRISFLSRGMQVLSSGSDGLLKLWTIKSNECIKTIDAHEDKIWAMSVSKSEENVITGAGDSTIIVWKDVTEEEWQEEKSKQEDVLLKEEQLANLLLQKKYVKAIGLAITLNQPFRVLNIMKDLLKQESGKEDVKKIILRLRDDQIGSVLGYAATWNTNSKHCHVAQFVIGLLLQTFPMEKIAELPNIQESIEGLIPYTERHFERMNRLAQQSMFVDYTWLTMNPVAPNK